MSSRCPLADPGAAPCLTPLDPPETPVASKDAPPSVTDSSTPSLLCNNHRHSGWANDRLRIHRALFATGASMSRCNAFSECGSSYWIMRSRKDPSLFKAVPDFCHDRFCVPCASTRQSLIRRNISGRLKNQPHRLLTLTIRHDSEPLSDLIKHLYHSFRRLRTRRLWRDRVRGGACFLEITYNHFSGSWHPHLHCVLEGSYIERSELSRLWLAASGDSCNVDLKFIRDSSSVINYVTKYATKPLPHSIIRDPDLLQEAIRALSSLRTIITIGSWCKWRLLARNTDDGWELFDHYNSVALRASLDDEFCSAIVSMLPTADPNTHEFFVSLNDDP